jgi:hypothetical protein
MTLNCPECSFTNPFQSSSCRQCGTQLPQRNENSSEDAEAKLRELVDQLKALTEEFQEKLTPIKTTSFNGCGVMLLDYRPVGEGNVEATRWITMFGLPIVPLSVWKIRPRKYSQDARGEKQIFDLLGKRRVTPERIIRPYAIILGGVSPFVLAYLFADLRPVVYFLSRHLGSWVAVGFIFILIILTLAWAGFIFTRFHNANKAYRLKR